MKAFPANARTRLAAEPVSTLLSSQGAVPFVPLAGASRSAVQKCRTDKVGLQDHGHGHTQDRRGNVTATVNPDALPNDVLIEDWLVVWGMSKITSGVAVSVQIDGCGALMGGVPGSTLLRMLDHVIAPVLDDYTASRLFISVMAQVNCGHGMMVKVALSQNAIVPGDCAMEPRDRPNFASRIEAVVAGVYVCVSLHAAVIQADREVGDFPDLGRVCASGTTAIVS